MILLGRVDCRPNQFLVKNEEDAAAVVAVHVPTGARVCVSVEINSYGRVLSIASLRAFGVRLNGAQGSTAAHANSRLDEIARD